MCHIHNPDYAPQPDGSIRWKAMYSDGQRIRSICYGSGSLKIGDRLIAVRPDGLPIPEHPGRDDLGHYGIHVSPTLEIAKLFADPGVWGLDPGFDIIVVELECHGFLAGGAADLVSEFLDGKLQETWREVKLLRVLP